MSVISTNPEADGLESQTGPPDDDHYVLRLYIIGSTRNSASAVANTRELCETYLQGHYDLEIIDIGENPSLAKESEIIAAPMLVKAHPLPTRRFVGDMSQTGRILLGLNVQTEDELADTLSNE